ncbi:MAG: hypothetical protein HC933_06110 [Pleurocapsa sp. SU_196_0]|nr:hypothetical protein [Pleurocapsa sp. SU_196_0]
MLKFGIGFVPILGAGIDCATAAVNLITNSEVDLLQAELGCIGMSIDAITLLAARPETTVATRGVLGTLRALNIISRNARGAMTRVGLLLVERFRSKGMNALEFVTELFRSQYLTRFFFEGGEQAARNLDELAERWLTACGISPRSLLLLETNALPLCGTQAHKFLRLFSEASDALTKGFGYGAADVVQVATEWYGKYVAKRFDPLETMQEIQNLGKAADNALVTSGTITKWISPEGILYGADRQHGT